MYSKDLRKVIAAVMLLCGVAVFAKVNAVVSILPQKTFLEKIGGENISITVMVPPGAEPHAYEPKPSQMKALSSANVYFTIGVEFEKAWMPKFEAQNSKMAVVDSSEGIKRIPMVAHHHGDEGGHEHDGHHHDGLDPHVWLSPANAKIIGQNIAQALMKLDPAHKSDYEKNLQAFLAQVTETDKQIRALLEPLPKPSVFMVFHPAWGYFAHAYGLTQIAIEVEGKEPKPKQLTEILDEAKEEKVHAIFAEPEFSDKSAKLIAQELSIPVIRISPLAADWSENLIQFAQTLAQGYQK